MSHGSDPERARQVRRLLRLGMSLDAATAAVDTDRVMLALLDHLVGGPREFTREQAAARAGVPLDVAETVDRIAGLAEDARYAEQGIRHLALLGRLLQVLPEEVVLDSVRADIPILRALALRTLDTVDVVLLREAMESTDDPIEAAVTLAEIGRPLLDLTTELVGQSFRRIVLGLITSDLVVEALRNPDETVEVAVGFIDVVGYTSLAGRIDPKNLGQVLTTFEASCQRLAETHPSVSLVKFLGDAGMFVSLDPVALATALCDAVGVDAPEGPASIPVSAGMAYGSALLRGGDYFGPPVNEAARLTDLARQHTVLVSDGLVEVLEGTFTLRRLKSVTLHGIGRRRPYALRGLAARS